MFSCCFGVSSLGCLICLDKILHRFDAVNHYLYNLERFVVLATVIGGSPGVCCSRLVPARIAFKRELSKKVNHWLSTKPKCSHSFTILHSSQVGFFIDVFHVQRDGFSSLAE